MTQAGPVIFTVGHSTRAIEAFLELLTGHDVRCFGDVRTVPRSRHNPQFNRMQTPAFQEGLQDCLALAESTRIALMCAEAVPWRCHRSLIADELVARGVAVNEITGPASSRPHTMTSWARVDGTSVTYPGPDSDLLK